MLQSSNIVQRGPITPLPADIAYKDRVVHQLNQVAPVTARSMFGGYGLYTEGVMFGLIAYQTLYFKIDGENKADYLEHEMAPFTYNRKGTPVEMSYYQLPATIFQDAEQLMHWVEKARAAAQRSKRGRRKKP